MTKFYILKYNNLFREFEFKEHWILKKLNDYNSYLSFYFVYIKKSQYQGEPCSSVCHDFASAPIFLIILGAVIQATTKRLSLNQQNYCQ